MPTYDFHTRGPILVTVNLDIGAVRATAGDRPGVTVSVRPRNRHDPCDMATARAARVRCTAHELSITAPRCRDQAGSGAVLVDIRVPAGCQMHGTALVADFHCEGELGECRIVTGCGHVRLGRSGPVYVSSALGNVIADRVAGDLEAVAGCGDIAVRQIDGAVDINRGTGGVRIGTALGDVRVYADSGDLSIDRAHGAVEARAAQGDIRVGRALRGPLVLETASGTLDVGIPDGLGASLDLDSHVGTVYRTLEFVESGAEALTGNDGDGTTVKVTARTIIGDILIRRTSHGQDTF